MWSRLLHCSTVLLCLYMDRAKADHDFYVLGKCGDKHCGIFMDNTEPELGYPKARYDSRESTTRLSIMSRRVLRRNPLSITTVEIKWRIG
jgi:hypothetical protein